MGNCSKAGACMCLGICQCGQQLQPPDGYWGGGQQVVVTSATVKWGNTVGGAALLLKRLELYTHLSPRCCWCKISLIANMAMVGRQVIGYWIFYH